MRNVVVTGGSRGLGLGIAEALAGSGFQVIAIARSEGGALPPVRDRLAAGPGALRFRAFDLSDVDGLRELIRSLVAEFGPLYGLVNNAAAPDSGVLATVPDARIERLVRLNVLSPLVLTKYVVRSIMTGGAGGRVVNVSSIVSATGYSGLSVYSATKSSLTGFTRSLARELGPLGITVNAVAPGFIDTEMTRELNPGARAKIARRSALQRAPDIIDVADAVDFLFSEKARNITGTVITVDAGNTA